MSFVGYFYGVHYSDCPLIEILLYPYVYLQQLSSLPGCSLQQAHALPELVFSDIIFLNLNTIICHSDCFISITKMMGLQYGIPDVLSLHLPNSQH